MGRAHLNGIELNYYRRPVSGPEVVLVHGLATGLAFWYFKILPLLSPDFNVTLYDLRGHGQSAMPSSGYTTADMAADLNALLDHLGLGRVHLVGHSYGGAVALHYAVMHPDRVASLTLADARIRCLQPTQRLEDWPDAETFKTIIRQVNPSASLDHPEMGYRFLEILAEAQVEGVPIQNAVAGMMLPFGWSAGRPSETARRFLKLLRTTTARRDILENAGLTPEKICSIPKPVLAIFGEYSNCLPSMKGLQQCISGCQSAIVPGAGHFHPNARPLYFGSVVRDFLHSAETRQTRRADG